MPTLICSLPASQARRAALIAELLLETTDAAAAARPGTAPHTQDGPEAALDTLVGHTLSALAAAMASGDSAQLELLVSVGEGGAADGGRGALRPPPLATRLAPLRVVGDVCGADASTPVASPPWGVGPAPEAERSDAGVQTAVSCGALGAEASWGSDARRSARVDEGSVEAVTDDVVGVLVDEVVADACRGGGGLAGRDAAAAAVGCYEEEGGVCDAAVDKHMEATLHVNEEWGEGTTDDEQTRGRAGGGEAMAMAEASMGSDAGCRMHGRDDVREAEAGVEAAGTGAARAEAGTSTTIGGTTRGHDVACGMAAVAGEPCARGDSLEGGVPQPKGANGVNGSSLDDGGCGMCVNGGVRPVLAPAPPSVSRPASGSIRARPGSGASRMRGGHSGSGSVQDGVGTDPSTTGDGGIVVALDGDTAGSSAVGYIGVSGAAAMLDGDAGDPSIRADDVDAALSTTGRVSSAGISPAGGGYSGAGSSHALAFHDATDSEVSHGVPALDDVMRVAVRRMQVQSQSALGGLCLVVKAVARIPLKMRRSTAGGAAWQARTMVHKRTWAPVCCLS